MARCGAALRDPVLLPDTPRPWAEIERVRLGEMRLTALEQRAEIMPMLGRSAEVTAEPAGLVRGYLLRERLCGQAYRAIRADAPVARQHRLSAEDAADIVQLT